jgi:hypothetical protein
VLGHFAFCEHDLGDALPERAMVIDTRVAQVRERQRGKLTERRFDFQRAAFDGFEKATQARCIHGSVI